MSTMCSLCGGFVQSEQGAEFPVCSLAGCICIGGEVETQDGFADAISILRQKGYRIIGYNFPRSDGWEADYMTAIVFSRHTVPDTLPSGFSASNLTEVNGVVCCRHYETTDFEKQIAQSASDLREWAGMLPAVDLGMRG